MNPNNTEISLASWLYHGECNNGISIGHYYTFPVNVWMGDGASFGQYASNLDPRGTTWHYYAITFDGSQSSTNRQQIYTDGLPGVNVSGYYPPAAITNPAGSTLIGGGDANNSAIMDEVRISSGIARSYGWVQTEYNNQNAPTTFSTTGSETAASTPSGNAFWFGEF